MTVIRASKGQTITDIIEGCRLGGISLEQRLAVIDHSSLPAYRVEAAMIREYLAQRRA